MRWGIMGLGVIAHEFAAALGQQGGIYAVASRDRARAEVFQSRFGAERAFGSYGEMLADENVDAVYVATVNARHLADMRACVEHGKHVLCEKAIWGNAAELRALRDDAKARGLVLAEAMTIYHMPIMKRIDELISKGALGTVKMVKADLGSLKEDDPKNRFFNPELGGGAMLDIGTYALSFLRRFMGPFEQLTCTAGAYPTGVDEMWAIAARSAAGILGTTSLTFRAKLPKRAIVAGDAAYVAIDNYVRADTATLVRPDGSSEEIRCGRTADALVYEVRDFEAAVSGDESASSIELTCDVVEAMERLLREQCAAP